LVETYDRLVDIVGIPDEKGNALLPPNHMFANTDVCITIDNNGNFLHAEETKKNIIIPCTEDSAARAGKVEYPHPLHDQLGYLVLDKKKSLVYYDQIKKWCSYHPKVEAVRKYIEKHTLVYDLNSFDIKSDEPKTFVRFSVEMSLDDKYPNLWEDDTIVSAWKKYCDDVQSKEQTLCYITGEELSIRTKHPKGINPLTHGAKLISSNDDTNYTYRGRFTKSNQANAISANSSHKAHAMLKYLIATQGYKCDTQVIVAWAVDNNYSVVEPFINSKSLHDSLGLYEETDKTILTDTDLMIDANNKTDRNYSRTLRNALSGYGNAASLNKQNRRIVVIAVDAATTGRMSITYYQDMLENDYIERIISWHVSCCWYTKYNNITYISAPSVDRIIAAIYGEPKGEGYNKIKKQARERLLHCIINGERINNGWLAATVHRVSNPYSYNKQDGGWDKYQWEDTLGVTCAIVRKYYLERGEEFFMELEVKCEDRDYLYGRLLAIADKLESHARYLQTGKNDTDKRATNAVRYMSAFAAKPFRTWRVIYDQLTPYIQRLDGADWYQRQIDEIMSLFHEGAYDDSKPLNGKYLLGYSLQRRALNKTHNEEEIEND
jgi:CRISPR-associated protein Csd1